VDYSVRRIQPDEGPRYRDIRLRALAEAPSAFGSTVATESALTDADWAARATRSAGGPDSAFFVAENRGGEWVGMAGGFREHDPPDTIHLVSMWVAPDCRRTGLGVRLIDEVVGWARAGEARAVELWVTRDNDPAASLYRRIGFVPTADYQPLPSDPCKEEERMRLVLPGA
jgi:ribosomal protein S18 acetylase RimI-like enzyme